MFLVFRNVERSNPRRHETLCKGKGQSADVGPWIGIEDSSQAYFRRYAGPCC